MDYYKLYTMDNILAIKLVIFCFLCVSAVDGTYNLCSDVKEFTIVRGDVCNSYLLCYMNRALLQGWCIAGTGYDPHYGRCTWKAYIQCEKNKLIRRKEAEGVFVCPGSLTEAFYPDYTSGCPTSHYIQCNSGVQKARVCPTGTYYNDGTGTCDVMTSISCSSYQCPQTLAYGVFADYSSGCPPNKYFICTGYFDSLTQQHVTVKTDQACPTGLYYNEGIKSCDFIQNIPCQHNLKKN